MDEQGNNNRMPTPQVADLLNLRGRDSDAKTWRWQPLRMDDQPGPLEHDPQRSFPAFPPFHRLQCGSALYFCLSFLFTSMALSAPTQLRLATRVGSGQWAVDISSPQSLPSGGAR
ncbi:hypothetical protein GQ53DRAFT_755748 [Thozetella sp. PMI_491]|nr:hypothetical protein GQ53DRAFT_755748 [Thozetella sp. PMI_491]